MKLAFIGAGKVGRSFGYYLKSNGFEVIGYSSRTKESEELASKETDSSVVTREEIVDKADLIFITTPDSQISKVCDEMADNIGFKKNHTLVHMSGGLSSKELKSAKDQGASTYSLHPLQSFANVQKAIQDLEKTFFTLEGEGDKAKLIKLFEKLNNPYVEIDPEKKSLYHGAASIASNYLVALTNIALRLLEDCGFKREEALGVAGTLMEGTMNNIQNYDTVEALTGPIARGDASTVDKHLKTLEDEGYDRILEIYRLLGLETVEIAYKKGLSEEEVIKLNKLLESNND
ncbi:Rossmann-like and DUF2520 domain-containing protein [Natranaerofaba carboxydovora]|uniref:Rossmann-like and DUF2520 domain-containing protein n=1 Tax=Natranaerofaba carboxydovora TaxID=2742683 RepID=UPI001F14447E|nr:Rossmann-like and DUF2520 domain-containing protein [Natranaerofaba carboxydovora]UMZ74832.1 hypothetical protein ACONDI_02435 [Natranaerofaba carboxydovora]